LFGDAEVTEIEPSKAIKFLKRKKERKIKERKI